MFNRDQRIGDAQRQIVVRVHPFFGRRIERLAECVHPLDDALRQQRSGGVDDVDTVSAVRFHELRLPAQLVGGRHVRHHQEPDDVHAQLAGVSNVLSRDVGLGRMGSDSHRLCARAMSGFQIFDRADARQQQNGDLRALHRARDRVDPVTVAVCAESVCEARTGKPVTVGDFDRIHAGTIEGGRDPRDIAEGILMPDGVHAIAKRDVLDVKFAVSHAIAPPVTADPAVARRSPVRSAAEVMMSRLPAYLGR